MLIDGGGGRFGLQRCKVVAHTTEQRCLLLNGAVGRFAWALKKEPTFSRELVARPNFAHPATNKSD